MVEPINVVVQDRELKISWSDGHQSVYSHKFLRESCPCAACKGESLLFGKAYIPEPPQVSEDIKPEKFSQVGAYALNIAWSDGHSSGIYTYNYLRELCQCGQCKK